MKPASWNAVKFVLAAGTPIQRLVSGKGYTHLFCNQQAVIILKNDGKGAYSQHVFNYLEVLNRGVLWADKGWKNLSHYFDPVEGIGLGPWPNARLECQILFKKALLQWERGNKKKAFFLLGAAVHLVQDLCVPHHARGVAFNGHMEYEKWVLENYSSFGVFSGGIYNNALTPGEWVEGNARVARLYFPYVSNTHTETSYRMVTEILLPLAQRSTAGFLSSFLESVKTFIR